MRLVPEIGFTALDDLPLECWTISSAAAPAHAQPERPCRSCRRGPASRASGLGHTREVPADDGGPFGLEAGDGRRAALGPPPFEPYRSQPLGQTADGTEAFFRA